MKALVLLKQNLNQIINKDHLLYIDVDESFVQQHNEAIKELEGMQKHIARLEEYEQFARNHLESYRCNCGSLGRVGYLCSNKECKIEE